VGLYKLWMKEFPQEILLRNRFRFRGRSSSPVTAARVVPTKFFMIKTSKIISKPLDKSDFPWYNM
jgi:hypothetical protein